MANSGALEAVGNTWAAGIEAQGGNAVAVTNSAAISAAASVFGQVADPDGNIVAAANGGTAFGIYATAGEGGAVVVNSGNIAVDAGYATGIEVQSLGDISVANSGNIDAGSGLNSTTWATVTPCITAPLIPVSPPAAVVRGAANAGREFG